MPLGSDTRSPDAGPTDEEGGRPDTVAIQRGHSVQGDARHDGRGRAEDRLTRQVGAEVPIRGQAGGVGESPAASTVAGGSFGLAPADRSASPPWVSSRFHLSPPVPLSGVDETPPAPSAPCAAASDRGSPRSSGATASAASGADGRRSVGATARRRRQSGPARRPRYPRVPTSARRWRDRRVVGELDARRTGRHPRRSLAPREAFAGARSSRRAFVVGIVRGVRSIRRRIRRSGGRADRALEQERNQQGPARGHRADRNIGRVPRPASVGRIASVLAALAALSRLRGQDDPPRKRPGRRRPAAPCTCRERGPLDRRCLGLITGSQHTGVRDSARGPVRSVWRRLHHRRRPAAPMAVIANQYAAQEAGPTKVKVLISGRGHLGHHRRTRWAAR